MNMVRPLYLLTGVAVLGLGAALIARSLSRGVDDAAGAGEHNADASVPYGEGARIEKEFTVQRPAAELYAYWRDLANLPEIMSHLQSVDVLDDLRSHWSASGPGGVRVTWDAEIIDDTPGRRIAWRSVGGVVPNAGSVTFNDAPDDCTDVRLEMEWTPPGGAAGASFAGLFGGDPGAIVDSDLRRFKETMEGAPRTA